MARLHHLALRTPDVSRLVTFYRAWFGLDVARDAAPRAVWLALDPMAVLMIEQAQPGEPGIPGGSLELLALALSSEERAALRERLVRAGLLEAETQHTLYFRDPDGRRVGVSSYPL
jgi:catechol 2,3-dioxygenase-like lactoylglutathione lyase family enzyme